jgi:hypothetical protein
MEDCTVGRESDMRCSKSSPLPKPPLVVATDSDAASLIARYKFPGRKKSGAER